MSIQSHIVGIGGIFFKAKNPEVLQEWYEEKLGFSVQVPYDEKDTAITFKWKNFENENHNTVWAPFPENTDYFKPSNKSFMINYIVKDMEGLFAKLSTMGIDLVGSIRTYKYGKFSHIIDPEGNKVEFWEPNREFFKDKYT